MAMPYIQFFPADWIRDTRGLSPAAKGMWMDTLCRLHQSETPGQETLKIRVWARYLGVAESELPCFASELREAKVGEVEEHEDGSITFRSRRMMQDANAAKELSEVRSKAGKAGLAKRWGKAKQSDSKPDSKPIASATGVAIAKPLLPSPSPSPERGERARAGGDPEIVPASEHDPPTLDEVLTTAAMDGVSEESAKAFWNHYEGRNLWLNRHERLIKWRMLLKEWGNKDQANGHQHNRKGGHGVDRNIGTANEGIADEYAGVGRVARD